MTHSSRSGERAATNHAERGLIDAARREAAAMSRGVGAFQREHPHLRPPPPDLFPGYELIREIHRGGQGVVYHAVQHSTRRDVAIKVVRNSALHGPRERARFELEMQILGQFDHPNIVTIHDSGTIGDCSYGVMDYIVGLPLDQYMALERRTVRATLSLFAKICDAVNVAHLRGVIHRDLKPGNIRVDHSGEPHILDFGLAKVSEFDVLAQTQARTVEGQFVGSLPWASPEQAEGSADLDIRADVYALGVILYQMLTGRFPYPVTGPTRDVVMHIASTEPVRPRTLRKDIGDEVETILLKCLSKDRERRYQGAGELARDVHRWLADDPIEAKRDSGWYVVRKSMRKHGVAVSAAAVMIILVCTAAVVSGTLWKQAERSAAEASSQRAMALREAAIAQTASSVLGGILKVISPTQAADDPLASLERIEGQLDEQFAGNPERLAWMQQALSVAYWHVAFASSQPEPALAGAERTALASLAILREQAGEDDVETLRAMMMLAGVAMARANDERAEQQARRVVETARASSPRHPYLPDALNGLAVILLEAGRHEEAVQTAREATEAARFVHGPCSSQLRIARDKLVLGLCNLKRYGEAESLARHWLEESSGLPEPDEVGPADMRRHALMLLVHVNTQWNRPEEAQQYQARVEAFDRERAAPSALPVEN